MASYIMPDGKRVSSLMLPKEIQRYFTINDYVRILYKNNPRDDVDYMTRSDLENGYHAYIGDAYLSQPWRMEEELGIREVR